MSANTKTASSFDVNTIAKIAVLGAIAFLLMMFEIPLPFSVPFYKLGFDEVAVLLAGFALGPVAGAITELLKILLNVIFQGTQTAYVGEFANLIMGWAFVLPSSIYYQKHKTREGAFKSLVIGSISLVIVGALANYFVMIPAFSYFYNLPIDAIIGMGTGIFSGVKDLFTFILFMTVPFNLVKGIVVSLVTALIYKRVSPILHK